MAYLLDTNILIHVRDGTDAVINKFLAHEGQVFMSAISLVELQRGVFKDPAATAHRRARLNIIRDSIPVVPFDEAAADIYGSIIARRGWVRSLDFDRMIAAHALSLRAILVTNNTADFKDIPGLTLENWAAA